MQLTYHHVKNVKEWTDGNPEKPFGSALIWVKPYGYPHTIYARIRPHPDSREKIFTFEVAETNNIECLIREERLQRESDIIRLAGASSDDWKGYLISLAQAYARGPETSTQQVLSWWQRFKNRFL